MRETVSVLDHGVRLDIPFEACVLYHGRESIGGLALGWRLLGFALDVLTPGVPPERSAIRFATAFPGPGVRDTMEMTVRAVTRGAWSVIEEAPEDAPEGVYGRMYFEVTAGAKTADISLRPGALPEGFVETGRRVVGGARDAETLARWRELRETLASAVLSASDEDLFVLRRVRG